MTPDLKAQFSTESIDAAIEGAEYQLAPAGALDVIAAIDKLMTFARAYNIQADRKGLIEIWRDGCQGMSRRALAEGLTEVLAKTTDTYRLPMTGAVRDIIREKLAKWESELVALREVRRQMLLPDVAQIAAPEDFDHDGKERALSPDTQAAMANSLRMLAAASPIKRMPRR